MAKFYRAAFGWRTQILDEEMGNYELVTSAETDARPGAAAGAINGGFYAKKPDWPSQYPAIVTAVEDIEAAMAAVDAAGGKLLGEPMTIPGIGLYLSFLDPEGNRSSMLQPFAPADS